MPPLVLVVEDVPAVTRITCRFLEEVGYHCIDAENAEQTLARLTIDPLPDLIVIDVRLPGMSGPELAVRIHQRHSRIPILFVSGWMESLAPAEDVASLRWEYVQKPYRGDALVSAARRLLG